MALQVQERTLTQKIDYNLILLILALNFIGLINLYSATHGPNNSEVELNLLLFKLNVNRVFMAQVAFLLFGWLIYFVITLLDYHFLLRLAYPLYAVNLFLLILVLAIGKISMGGQRWLDLGFFRFQPSETMKLVMVFALARYFHNHSRPGGFALGDLIVPGLMILIPTVIIIKQPDLGTGMLVTLVSTSILLFVGVQRKVLIGAAIIATLALPIAWKFVLHDYQKNRIFTFLDPNRDPRGAGYNSIQSKIAVGSGRIFGKGFQKGTQSQLEFLPERHTDFIFSVLSEEHGFIGSITTLSLFSLLFLMAVRISTQANDKFGALLVIGAMSILFWHMFINIGMTSGLLPIVGIPLPLISYGGSSLLTTMMGLGVVSSISLRRFLF